MDDAKQTPTPYRYVVETLLFLTYAVFGLSWIALSPIATEVQAEFHVTAAQFGLLTTMVSVAKVLAPLATGLLAVRIGIKKTILLGSVLIACSALAPFAHDFNLFLASRFIFGVGGAIVVTLLGPMVMQWFPAEERPLINAFNNVAVNTGITVTLFATVPLADAFGWRNTLLAYGLVSVALAVAWAILGREATVPTPSSDADQTPVAAATYGDVWRMKETWLIALAFAGPLALYLAYNTFLPKYYMEAFGWTKAAASSYTGLFNLVGIPTAIAAGLLSKKLGLRRPFIIGAGLLMGVAAFGMIWAPSPALVSVAAVGLGIALFTYVAPLFTIPMELPGATPQKVSLIMGTVFSFAYFFSSLSPVVVGMVHDATGSYFQGFALWAVFSLVLALAGFLLPETGPAAKPQAPTGTPQPANSQA